MELSNRYTAKFEGRFAVDLSTFENLFLLTSRLEVKRSKALNREVEIFGEVYVVT